MRIRFDWSLCWVACGALTFARLGAAQMPGAPVLQNAWSNPGFAVAANVSTLQSASSYAAAAAWAPASGRLKLRAGVGAQTKSKTPTRVTYGGRVNATVLGMQSNFGVSVFAGYGGLSGKELDSAAAKSLVPLGATASYRMSGGMVRGLSVYASPVYEWIARGGGAGNVSVFRGSIGLDIGLTSSIGVTLGVELGAKYDAGTGKPSGTAFGAGVSYVIGGAR
jgi:hypothetical protein